MSLQNPLDGCGFTILLLLSDYNVSTYNSSGCNYDYKVA